MMGRQARASTAIIRLWSPNDPGGSCLLHTIGRYRVLPHNRTDRENAGALPAQEEAATEIDEIIVTGQRDYLYRADQSDALGTSIPLAELPATVNVITEDFLEDTRAYDIEDV